MATAGGLAVLLPTFLDRCDLSEHLDQCDQLAEQLDLLQQELPELPLTWWIGMQHGPGRQRAAVERLAAMIHQARTPRRGVVGFCLSATGKLQTTNAAITLAAPWSPRAWLWLDDDVLLEPECLLRLTRRFVATGMRGAMGARVRVHSSGHWSARALQVFSRHTAPRHAVPQACCELVAAQVVEPLIPHRTGADDGFVLFQLLRPHSSDPFRDLVIVEEAVCHVVRGGGAGALSARFRRAMFGHVLHVAEYPWPTAQVYLRDQLLHGLWPLAGWGTGGMRPRAARWLAKAVMAGWLLGAALALALRGAIGRPRATAPGHLAGSWSHGTLRQAPTGASTVMTR